MKINCILFCEEGTVDYFHNSSIFQALSDMGSIAVFTMLPFTVKTNVYTTNGTEHVKS